MLTVGPFEMATEAGSVCTHITHSGAQSLLLTVGGWRRMQGAGGGGWECRKEVIEGYLAKVHTARRCHGPAAANRGAHSCHQVTTRFGMLQTNVRASSFCLSSGQV